MLYQLTRRRMLGAVGAVALVFTSALMAIGQDGQKAAAAPPAKIKIATIPIASYDGKFEQNYARALRLAEESLKFKPDIILLPEAFAAGYCGRPLREFVETPETSEHLANFQKISADGDCMVVLGYLEKVEGGGRVRNAVIIYDRGKIIGKHYKYSLWKDDNRPYRDEPSQFIPGKEIEVFNGRFGRFAVMTCYENMLPANWDALRGKVDFVLSPYNCEKDPAHHNFDNAKRLGIPSAWADRTGTVFAGQSYAINQGSAGIVDATGEVIARSPPAVEEIVVGEVTLAGK